MVRFLFPFSFFLFLFTFGCGSSRSVQAQLVRPDISLPRLQNSDNDRSEANVKRTSFEAVKIPIEGAAEGRVTVKIRAQVNGEPIFDEEVRTASYPLLLQIMSLPEPERSAKQTEIVQEQLDRLIERELVLQDLSARFKKRQQQLDKLKEMADKEFDKYVNSMKRRNKVKSDEEFKKMLTAQGLTLESFRRQFARNFLATQYVHHLISGATDKIGHQQILDYYEQHKSDFQAVDTVQWQDIFLDVAKYKSREEARQAAQKIVDQARQGADLGPFLSYDNGDSSYRNGEGFGRRRGEIRPSEVEPYLFHMRDGEVGPVVEIATGFHVFKLIKREYAGQTPLNEKVQNEIKKKIMTEVEQKEVKRYVAMLRRKATIEINPAQN